MPSITFFLVRSPWSCVPGGDRQIRTCVPTAATMEAIERILDPREMLSPGVRLRWKSRAIAACSTRSPTPAISSWGGRFTGVSKTDGLAAGKDRLNNLRQALDAVDQIIVWNSAPGRRPPDHRGAARRLWSRTDRWPHHHSAGIEPGLQAGLRPDEGPNTGGIGDFSPTPRVTPALMEEVEQSSCRSSTP